MELSRRDVICLASFGIGAASAGHLSAINNRNPYKVDQNLLEDKEFIEKVNKNYSEAPNFKYELPNVLIDLRYVEGIKRETDDTKRNIESFFNELELNMSLLERKEDIDEQNFHENYSNSLEDILGDEDSLWADEVEEYMRDSAIQAFYVPDNIFRGYHKDDYVSGVCLQDSTYPRAAVSAELSYDLRERALTHEIGHALGLGHVEDPKNVMFPRALDNEYGGLTEKQEEKILSNLV